VFALLIAGQRGEMLNIIAVVPSGFADSCSAAWQEEAMGKKVWVPVVSQPLAPYTAGFGSWLRSQAYSPSAAAGRLCQFDQVSRLLEREGLNAEDLTDEQAGRFIAARRAAVRATWVSPRSMALLLGYLRELGVAPVSAPAFA